MKKVILMVFLIFSLLMIVYGIGFILNYANQQLAF